MLALAVAALATTTSAASAGELPAKWDPRAVAVNREPGNTFLLRPGQILVAPGDAADVARVLKGWKPHEQRPFGITVFTRPTQNPADPAREVMDALATIRRATANRPQGPAQVAPNHVFVGEAASASAINFMGEPRIQGGPGSTVRQATHAGRAADAHDPAGTAAASRSRCWTPACSSTSGSRASSARPAATTPGTSRDDGYGDDEAGHGTFIAGLIMQVAPAASVYAVKVLDSHGVGDDLNVAKAMEQLPADVNIINLSLGGYTDRDAPPMAVATAMAAMGQQQRVVVAAAGNHGKSRPFWPAAFDQVLAVGAVDEAGQVDPRPLQQPRPVGRRHRPRLAPAVHVRHREDEDRARLDDQPVRPDRSPSRAGPSGTGPRSPRRSPPR